MQDPNAVKVLFIAGVGPIVRDPDPSRKLYADDLGIAFKEESGGYRHTEALQGARSFALWPLPQAAQSCFGTEVWPADIPDPRGSSSKWTTSRTPPRYSNVGATGCSSGIGRSRGVKRSVASYPRKDCWLP